MRVREETGHDNGEPQLSGIFKAHEFHSEKNMDGEQFYRGHIGNRYRNQSTSSPNSSRSSSPMNFNRSSTYASPLSSRSQHREHQRQSQENALAISISTCQEQLATVLRSLETTNGRLSTLFARMDEIEKKINEQPVKSEQEAPTSTGKRKRTKDALIIQVLYIAIHLIINLPYCCWCELSINSND